jgi:F-box and leucine-rich repeat protein 2/20
MAQTANPQQTASPRPMTPTSPAMAELPYDQPIKSRRRQRIVQGLQRISSSPSLARLGRSRTSEYRSGGLASISCISLGSPLPSTSFSPPNSYSSQISAGYSTAPTSPGSIAGGNCYLTPNAKIRFVERDRAGNEISTLRSVPLPSEAQSCEDLEIEAKTSTAKPYPRRVDFNFWADLPHEIRVHILQFLSPKQIIRLSSVSRSWHDMCFDGQLWTELDCQSYYQQITSDALIKIMLRAGAFVKNLNLRGCVQLRDQWLSLGTRMTNQECRNLENFSIEGCKIERSSIHFFLLRNPRLLHINMPSMQNINNSTMKIIASHCPLLEFLNIDWCSQVDTKGLKKVVQSCPKLTDLRASELRGLDDGEFMLELFHRNGLERLIIQHCDTLTDESLSILTNGIDPEIDPLTERTIVPPRCLRHLDISKCRSLTDKGVKSMAYNMPYLEGFRLCQNHALTDDGLIDILSNTPRLTHLEFEEVELLTNAVLTTFAATPGASSLEHLSISYCEHLGDVGVLPVLKACQNLTSLCLDNTRVSDLVLMEAAEQVRKRGSTTNGRDRPKKGLSLVAFDCQNVTWAGVREIMSQNTRVLQSRSLFQHKTLSRASVNEKTGEVSASPAITTTTAIPVLLYPKEIIHLKAFYGWQQTVEEHYKRCTTARWSAAARLEGKWAEWMLASEEAVVGGGHGTGWGGRRRRRRAREAENRVRDDEDGGDTGGEDGYDGGDGLGGRGRNGGRRRARSGGCVVM